MLLVNQVAHWGKEIERHGKHALNKRGFSSTAAHEILSSYRKAAFEVDDETEEDVVDLSEHQSDRTGKVIDENQINKLTGSITQSQIIKMNELLGKWEEPEVVGEQEVRSFTGRVVTFSEKRGKLTFVFIPKGEGINRIDSPVPTDAGVYGRGLSLFYFFWTG